MCAHSLKAVEKQLLMVLLRKCGSVWPPRTAQPPGRFLTGLFGAR